MVSLVLRHDVTTRHYVVIYICIRTNQRGRWTDRCLMMSSKSGFVVGSTFDRQPVSCPAYHDHFPIRFRSMWAMTYNHMHRSTYPYLGLPSH